MSKKLKKLSDANAWTRWNERMTRVRHELHYVYSTRKRFNDVTWLFENNQKLKSIGGEVYDWMFRLWARDIVISIRRELDNDTNTVCLGRLLDEMAQRPQVITRARYLGDIPKDDTLGDVNRTVEAMDEIFIKYYALIVGPSLMGLERRSSGTGWRLSRSPGLSTPMLPKAAAARACESSFTSRWRKTCRSSASACAR